MQYMGNISGDQTMQIMTFVAFVAGAIGFLCVTVILYGTSFLCYNFLKDFAILKENISWFHQLHDPMDVFFNFEESPYPLLFGSAFCSGLASAIRVYISLREYMRHLSQRLRFLLMLIVLYIATLVILAPSNVLGLGLPFYSFLPVIFGIVVGTKLSAAWEGPSEKIEKEVEEDVRKYKEEAKQLLDSGDWQSAAVFYKKAIFERMMNPGKLHNLTGELADIYRKNGIEADFSKVLETPRLFNEIFDAKITRKERNRLVVKLHNDVLEILNKYPGKLTPTKHPVDQKTEATQSIEPPKQEHQDVISIVSDIVAKQFKLPKEQIGADYTFDGSLASNNSEMDELRRVLEETFGLVIDTEEVGNIKAVGQVADYVKRTTNGELFE
jgi:acyl carrier protein